MREMTRRSAAGRRPSTGPHFLGRSGAWRHTDFLLFLLVPLPLLRVGGYPVTELCMLAAVAVAVPRKPRAPLPGWVLALSLSFMLWLCVTALINDLQPVRRLVHLSIFFLLVGFVGQGRFAMRSVAVGLASGLLLAVAAATVGLGNAGYQGRLTGLLGDPNLAGYYLVALGAVASAHIADRRLRLVLLAFVAVAVVLTFSRTSILAMGLVGVWILGRRRLSPLANIALVGALLYAISRSLDYLRLVGPFAQRAGSDALRERIVDLERLQIAESPWVGHGPGTSTVVLEGQTFFFHNSYLALQHEGGWIALAIFMVLGGTALFQLAGLPRSQGSPWLEASIVAVATCAANLGEVLLDLPTAIVIGGAVWHVSARRRGAASLAHT
jgi:O-antigen ligase